LILSVYKQGAAVLRRPIVTS